MNLLAYLHVKQMQMIVDCASNISREVIKMRVAKIQAEGAKQRFDAEFAHQKRLRKILFPILIIITAALSWEETNSSYRICHYDLQGSDYPMPVPLTRACPLTIEVEL